MKKFAIMMALLAAIVGERVVVMAWNVENFFDFKDDGVSASEAEFSATGARRWSKRRFYTKCNAIAKTILWAGTPDVVVLEEVENAFVLRQLLTQTALRKLDYRIIHYDSPDPRGIDVAMLYRSSRLELLESHPVRVATQDTSFHTRDILVACFRSAEGDSIGIMGCHLPSKYGGGESDWKRMAVTAKITAICDTLKVNGYDGYLALGDFNDTPENGAFDALPLTLLPKPSDGGSIRFNGLWQLIDLAFASPAVAGKCHFCVLRPPFLTTRDATHSGEKPLRTYVGPRYVGGVSDHCPILVEIGDIDRFHSGFLP